MIIGVDFDNTLVCYDKIFRKVAVDYDLGLAESDHSKKAVRDAIRAGSEDGEHQWQRLQGQIYGCELHFAELFSGVTDFLDWCSERNFKVTIVSHKTRTPALGPQYDLHDAAWRFLKEQKILNCYKALDTHSIFFEETRSAKINRIISEKCDVFIDDLIEVLRDAQLPARVMRIHFCPMSDTPGENLYTVRNWHEIIATLQSRIE